MFRPLFLGIGLSVTLGRFRLLQEAISRTAVALFAPITLGVFMCTQRSMSSILLWTNFYPATSSTTASFCRNHPKTPKQFPPWTVIWLKMQTAEMWQRINTGKKQLHPFSHHRIINPKCLINEKSGNNTNYSEMIKNLAMLSTAYRDLLAPCM